MRRVDIAIVSHANLDHYSGLPTLMRRISVERWLTNAYFADPQAPHSPLKDLLAQLPQPDFRPAALHAGDQLRVGDATLDVLWPPEGLDETWTVNDRSLVLRVTVAGHTILATGDLEEHGLVALLESEQCGRVSLQADVLIAPHHGQVIPGVTERFYAAVAPARGDRLHANAAAEAEVAGGRYPGPDGAVLLTGEVGSVTVRITPTAELRWRPHAQVGPPVRRWKRLLPAWRRTRERDLALQVAAAELAAQRLARQENVDRVVAKPWVRAVRDHKGAAECRNVDLGAERDVDRGGTLPHPNRPSRRRQPLVRVRRNSVNTVPGRRPAVLDGLWLKGGRDFLRRWIRRRVVNLGPGLQIDHRVRSGRDGLRGSPSTHYRHREIPGKPQRQDGTGDQTGPRNQRM